MFQELIFTICMCAVLSAAVQLIAPAKLRRELGLVCALLVIASASAAFTGNKTELPHIKDTSQLTAEYEHEIIEQTRKSIEDRVMAALHARGIFPEWLVIDCSLDEYNYVRADKVTIYLSEDQDEKAAERAAKDSAGDCRIEVIK